MIGGVFAAAILSAAMLTGCGRKSEAEIKYLAAAENGDAEAQVWLGWCYANGQGVSKDLKEAAKWYRKSAEQGLKEAQYSLGLCYYNGRGVPQSYEEAVKWYRKAAEQGVKEAQYDLGKCYENGQGVSKDINEAVKWYRKAAVQGVKEAQYSLGLCYANGQGVPKDFAEAAKWYRKSAVQGVKEAQYDLGKCHENGQGVPRDINEAAKWYRKAAVQGVREAQEALDKIKAEEARRAEELRREEARRVEELRREEARRRLLSTGVLELPGNVRLELVKVEAGTFAMGDSDEHQVTLTKDFYLGKTEVTQAQYKAVVGSNPSNFKGGDDLPVEKVSWNDAIEFCKKLNEMGKAPTGWKFTLPTEAQWEYAARGGKSSRGYKYSGSNYTDEVAWDGDNSGYNTHPVAQKRSNELGLYDMSGNVREWCRDWYEGGYARDPEFLTGNSGWYRVIRGGGWTAGDCRSAVRGNGDPGDRSFDLGFRVALVPVR